MLRWRPTVARLLIGSAVGRLLPRCCAPRSTPLRAVRKTTLQDTIIVADITDAAPEAGERRALFAVISSAAGRTQRVAFDPDVSTCLQV